MIKNNNKSHSHKQKKLQNPPLKEINESYR